MARTKSIDCAVRAKCSYTKFNDAALNIMHGSKSGLKNVCARRDICHFQLSRIIQEDSRPAAPVPRPPVLQVPQSALLAEELESSEDRQNGDTRVAETRRDLE